MQAERIVTSRLTTRGYELCSGGTIPPSTFLRYLEHTRWNVLLSASPLSLHRHFRIGVVRAERLELLHQVSFHVDLEFSVWVSRVGRTSIDLAHEVRRAQDDVLVARAGATIVSLDQDRRPTPISEEARALVTERPLPQVEPLGETAPDGAWSTPILIRPSDQDLQQHVNHARYADFVDDVRQLCAREQGYGPGPWSSPVGRLLIEFEQEARVGQALAGRTWKLGGAAHAVGVELYTEGGAVVTRARLDLQVQSPAK